MDENKKHIMDKAMEDTMTPEELAAYRKSMATKPTAKKGVVAVKSLRVRKEHNTDAPVVEGLVAGNEVEIFETWTDGKNTWAKLGPDKWAAMVYEGETYIKEG
jgi:hypothetical protein